MLKTYTVFGIYDEEEQGWTESVQANDPYEAAGLAVKAIMERQNYPLDLAENIGVVDVIEGEHKSLGEPNIAWATTLLGMFEPDPNRN